MTDLLLLFFLSILSSSTARDAVNITLTSRAETDNQGNCVQLLTCNTGPIIGNLFWYATFSNGSEIRFARNDGGNGIANPPYIEFTLANATDYFTSVTRSLMDGDEFTDFNSTLSFDVQPLLDNRITSILCGSTTKNSSKIALVPQLPEGDYHLYEVNNSIGGTFECIGSNIPLNIMVGNCFLSTTTKLLLWSINGTTVVQYDYIMGSLRNVSEYSDEYTINTTILEPQNYKLNVISRLQVISDLPPGTTVSCGSNFIRNDTLIISNDQQCEVSVTASDCFQSITCSSRINGECEVHIGRNRTDAISHNSVMGPVNSSINTKSLFLKWPDDNFYVAKLNIEGCEKEETLSDLEDAARVLHWHIAIIAIGVFSFVLSFLFMVIGLTFIFKLKRTRKKICQKRIIKVGVIVGIIEITVCVLWIVTAVVVAIQRDVCNSTWQSTRDGLIIASFIMAVFSACLSVLLLLYLLYNKMKAISIRTNQNQKEPILVLAGITNVKDVTFDETGRSSVELNVCQLHRGIGKNCQDQIEAQEKLTMAVKKEMLKETHHVRTSPDPATLTEYHKLNTEIKHDSSDCLHHPEFEDTSYSLKLSTQYLKDRRKSD